MTHDIFGIVNCTTNESAVYLFDERVGPIYTNHTISYLSHYISKLPEWMCRVLDNTCSTNKNWYTMVWALEMCMRAHAPAFITRIDPGLLPSADVLGNYAKLLPRGLCGFHDALHANSKYSTTLQ